MAQLLLADQSLEEQLSQVNASQRRFLLYRIAGMDFGSALVATHIQKTAYNHWTMQEAFHDINLRVPDLHRDYQQEALKLIRRNNQLAMTLMESELIAQMREEIETGEYHLLKTQIAKEVYARLISELDAVQPKGSGPVTWEGNLGVQVNVNSSMSEEDIRRIQRANGQADSSQTEKRIESIDKQETVQLDVPLLPRVIP